MLEALYDAKHSLREARTIHTHPVVFISKFRQFIELQVDPAKITPHFRATLEELETMEVWRMDD